MRFDAVLAGKRLRALREAGGWSTRDLERRAAAAGRELSHTTVSQVELGRRKRRSIDVLETLALVLGWPDYEAMLESEALEPPRPPNGVTYSPDKPATVVSTEGEAALPPVGDFDGRVTDTPPRWYPGYVLWRDEDPRDATTAANARRPGRRVSRQDDELFAMGDVVIAVRVEDVGPLVMQTSFGQVGPKWTFFVDQAKAATVAPGKMVAAMSEGQLVAGQLRQTPEGAWVVRVSPTSQRPIRREDIVGEVVRYQMPTPITAWIPDDHEPPPGGSEPAGPHYVNGPAR